MFFSYNKFSKDQDTLFIPKSMVHASYVYSLGVGSIYKYP